MGGGGERGLDGAGDVREVKVVFRWKMIVEMDRSGISDT